jgi:hypothetical protein
LTSRSRTAAATDFIKHCYALARLDSRLGFLEQQLTKVIAVVLLVELNETVSLVKRRIPG